MTALRIVEYIRYALTAHTGEELVESYRAPRKRSSRRRPRRSAGSSPAVSTTSSQFILRIEWKSAEDHMQGFRKGAQFPRS